MLNFNVVFPLSHGGIRENSFFCEIQEHESLTDWYLEKVVSYFCRVLHSKSGSWRGSRSILMVVDQTFKLHWKSFLLSNSANNTKAFQCWRYVYLGWVDPVFGQLDRITVLPLHTYICTYTHIMYLHMRLFPRHSLVGSQNTNSQWTINLLKIHCRADSVVICSKGISIQSNVEQKLLSLFPTAAFTSITNSISYPSSCVMIYDNCFSKSMGSAFDARWNGHIIIILLSRKRVRQETQGFAGKQTCPQL